MGICRSLLHGRHEQHVRANRSRARSIPARALASTLGAKGRKPSRNLILIFMLRLHARAARIAEDAARAERPRAELHPALETSRRPFLRPASPATRSSSSARVERLVHGPRRLQEVLDLARRERRAQVGAVHRRRPARPAARLFAVAVPDEYGHAEGAAGIPGGRLNPDVARTALRAAGARCRRSSKPRPRPGTGSSSPVSRCTVRGHAQHDLLGDLLDGARQIHLALGQLRLRARGGAAEQLSNAPLVIVRPWQ